MFSNIGGKIKMLAMVLCGIGSAASILLGIVLLVNEAIIVGIIFMLIGPLLSWIGSFILYGFGHLVENSDRMVSNTAKSLAIQKLCKDDLSFIIENLPSQKDDT
ncbi:MAG: hypothetical protein J1E00_04670 [Oscillospiraceae bacterium]|nr:hypothetical protein [Oscillospiraceae bacterium]